MTDLRTAAQQALETLEDFKRRGHWGDFDNLTGALKAALAEYDKDRVKVEEMKANWALQRRLAEETQERDRQQREYEEQRLAALAEPVQEPVAWRWGYRSVTTGEMDWRGYVDMAAHPNLRSPAITEPLYTAPLQRKPLTEEEIDSIWDSEKAFADIYAIARAVERAHGIGDNT